MRAVFSYTDSRKDVRYTAVSIECVGALGGQRERAGAADGGAGEAAAGLPWGEARLAGQVRI